VVEGALVLELVTLVVAVFGFEPTSRVPDEEEVLIDPPECRGCVGPSKCRVESSDEEMRGCLLRRSESIGVVAFRFGGPSSSNSSISGSDGESPRWSGKIEDKNNTKGGFQTVNGTCL